MTRLDRIEADARAKIGKRYVTVVALSPAEALALVEVAKAAQDTASRIVDGPEFRLGELFNSGGRLDAALARLEDTQ